MPLARYSKSQCRIGEESDDAEHECTAAIYRPGAPAGHCGLRDTVASNCFCRRGEASAHRYAVVRNYGTYGCYPAALSCDCSKISYAIPIVRISVSFSTCMWLVWGKERNKFFLQTFSCMNWCNALVFGIEFIGELLMFDAEYHQCVECRNEEA